MKLSFRFVCCLASLLVISLVLIVNLSVGQNPDSPADPSNDEFKVEWLSPELVREFSSASASDRSYSSVLNSKKARFVYLIPSDRSIRDDYKAALTDAALYLQYFYQKELGTDKTFDPVVEIYQTSHTAAWYKTNPNGGFASYFVNNTLQDGFALTGGFFGDLNNRWNFFIDADPDCGQGLGANGVPPLGGWAVLAANDLRGLTRQGNVPQCSGQNPDNAGIYRWIGGAGHELGHTWDLPHPPGCDSGACTGGSLAFNSWMYVGYYYFPNTYFLVEDKQKLLTNSINAPFFQSTDLRPGNYVDVDNDRNADLSVWRPSNGNWITLLSSSGNTAFTPWGLNGDKLIPGDYDGDKKSDSSVWRPSDRTWYILQSSTNTFFAITFGLSSDIPVPDDYDGDLKTDIAVWRPSNGTWYVYRSSSNTNYQLQFGTNGDRPVSGDYNGDKRADLAVFRPSQNVWYIYNHYTNNSQAIQFGLAGDKLVPRDYDGDSKTDIAVWRPSDGKWYILASQNGFQATQFGLSGDIPVAADYDGDGHTDIGIWRPSTATFWVLQSSNGVVRVGTLGQSSDIPVASALVR